MSTPEPPAGPPPAEPPYPPYPRYQPPPTPPNPHKARDFFIGLGLGVIPAILAILGVGTSSPTSAIGPIAGYLLGAGAVLYVAAIIATIVLLSIRRTQRLGVGMLVAVAVGPVVFGIGCVVALSRGPFL